MDVVDTKHPSAAGRRTATAPRLPLHDALEREGFAGPIDLLSASEAATLRAHLQREGVPAPLDWAKGRAATDRVIYEVAAMPQLLALLRPMLGEDIVLWGAQRIVRKPGAAHAWHCDLESAAPDGRFVTVWLGLQGVSTATGLTFIAGSHRFGQPVQQALAEGGGPDSDARVLELAREIDPTARLVRQGAADGQAVLFDGRIWHAGRNETSDVLRVSLLLQYAAADMVLRMPASDDYRWPFRFGGAGRLPVILVSGSNPGREAGGVNRLIPPPAPLQAREAPMISTRAHTVALPLAEDPVSRWRIYKQFQGPTRTFEKMSCHISVLSPGHVPHPPHRHADEELLIVLDGEVEIILAKDPADPDPRRLRLRPGMLSYYPSTQYHTITNPGAAPVTYLMFKWIAGDAGTTDPMQAGVFTYDEQSPPAGAPAFFKRRLFEQATHRLGKLHAHLTTLQAGAGYPPHVDAYDVAILVLSGEVETLGTRVAPLGIVYYAAGETHGMRNVGTTPATYLVFEFHSPAAVALKTEAQRQARTKRAAEKAARKAAKKRSARGILKRIGKLLKRFG